jgi:hypothetical protein
MNSSKFRRSSKNLKLKKQNTCEHHSYGIDKKAKPDEGPLQCCELLDWARIERKVTGIKIPSRHLHHRSWRTLQRPHRRSKDAVDNDDDQLPLTTRTASRRWRRQPAAGDEDNNQPQSPPSPRRVHSCPRPAVSTVAPPCQPSPRRVHRRPCPAVSTLAPSVPIATTLHLRSRSCQS